jgi:hypothetical protein
MRLPGIAFVIAIVLATTVVPTALGAGTIIEGCLSGDPFDPGLFNESTREEMDSFWRKFWDSFFGAPDEPECPEKGSTCKSCESHCICEYNKQLKDCDGQICRDGADSEKNACLGQCLIDYMDCVG